MSTINNGDLWEKRTQSVLLLILLSGLLYLVIQAEQWLFVGLLGVIAIQIVLAQWVHYDATKREMEDVQNWWLSVQRIPVLGILLFISYLPARSGPDRQVSLYTEWLKNERVRDVVAPVAGAVFFLIVGLQSSWWTIFGMNVYFFFSFVLVINAIVAEFVHREIAKQSQG